LCIEGVNYVFSHHIQAEGDSQDVATIGSESSAIEDLMRRGYTKEQATAKYNLDMRRREDAEKRRLAESYSAYPPTRHQDDSWPGPSRSGSQEVNRVDRTLFNEEYHPPFRAAADAPNGYISAGSFPPPPPPLPAADRLEQLHQASDHSSNTPQDVDGVIEVLMARGFTKEQATFQIQRANTRAVSRSGSSSDHGSPLTPQPSLDHYPPPPHYIRSLDSRSFDSREVPLHGDSYFAPLPVDRADPYAQFIDDYAIYQKNYLPCYVSVELDEDEGLEVALLESRNLAREVAVYVFFKHRLMMLQSVRPSFLPSLILIDIVYLV
jgi:hypothetical protein